MRKIVLLISTLCVLLPLAGQAVPVDAEVRDTPRQDILVNHLGWHELGIGFPQDELITATDAEDLRIPCPTDYLGGINYLITIVNQSDIFWTDLHYVADPETTFTNDDGEAQDLKAPGWTLAFRIDNVGANQPLVFESMTADNIFEPGETWQFLVQDYNNSLGLAPSLLDSWDGISQGQISYASAGGPPSSASIIAVPEPATAMLLFVSAGVIGFYRRVRKYYGQ
jgi:hypothetical protein